MLFTAYAIVRTVPGANRPNRRGKKKNSGETSRVNDLDRVSPTVILPRQSSVSSVGEPLE